MQIKLCGSGGQGIILSGNIIGKAGAIYEGKEVAFTQYYGPESRGGVTTASVIISDEKIDYPYITKADVFVAMSQRSYDSFKEILSDNGIVIYDSDLVKITGSHKEYGLPFTKLAQEKIGKSLVANIIMLGSLIGISKCVSKEHMKTAILDSVPKGTEELNTKAFELGFEESLKI